MIRAVTSPYRKQVQLNPLFTPPHSPANLDTNCWPPSPNTVNTFFSPLGIAIEKSRQRDFPILAITCGTRDYDNKKKLEQKKKKTMTSSKVGRYKSQVD